MPSVVHRQLCILTIRLQSSLPIASKIPENIPREPPVSIFVRLIELTGSGKVKAYRPCGEEFFFTENI